MCKLLTIEDVCEILQVSRETVVRMIHANKIPAFKVSGQWRFERQDLLEWFEELKAQHREKFKK